MAVIADVKQVAFSRVFILSDFEELKRREGTTSALISNQMASLTWIQMMGTKLYPLQFNQFAWFRFHVHDEAGMICPTNN